MSFNSASGCHQCWWSCGASDCQDWYDLGHTTSGVYHVTPCGTRFGYDVYCDMETDGGGWLVIILIKITRKIGPCTTVYIIIIIIQHSIF